MPVRENCRVTPSCQGLDCGWDGGIVFRIAGREPRLALPSGEQHILAIAKMLRSDPRMLPLNERSPESSDSLRKGVDPRLSRTAPSLKVAEAVADELHVMVRSGSFMAPHRRFFREHEQANRRRYLSVPGGSAATRELLRIVYTKGLRRNKCCESWQRCLQSS
jgi:hypothetical protein